MTIKEFQKIAGGKIINGKLVITGYNIDLSYKKITNIPKGVVFRNSGGIDLSNNKITKINGIFKNSGGVDLSNNKITKIDGVFKNSGYVDLNYNKITKINGSIFKNSGNVYLSDNNITKINGIFKNSGYVDLHNNKIIKINGNVFKNSGSVYLSDNNITKIDGVFKNSGYVDLRNNKIIKINGGVFKNSGSVYLNNNKITKLPKSMGNIKNLYIFENVNWNDIEWINKILQDKLTAEEVFAIDNIEHRRIAYEYMDKIKMKDLNGKVIDKVADDGYGNEMKLYQFKIQDLDLLFLNCFCPSTKREYFLQTKYKKCWKAKAQSFGLNNNVEWVKEW